MDYKTILQEAHEAGVKAGDACRPVAMIVGEAKDVPGVLFSDEIDYNKPTEYIADGVCGFAWVVTNEHGNGPFIKYLKKCNLLYNTVLNY